MSSHTVQATMPTAENGTVLTGVPTHGAGANIHGLGHHPAELFHACRRKGVECASWPQSQVYDALTSGIDGVGAQSIFVLAREGRQRAIACLLVKAGVGIRDAWARHGLTRAEMEEFLDQVAG